VLTSAVEQGAERKGWTTPSGYKAIAGYFDDLAPKEDVWRRRTAPYHNLLRSICRSLVPPGQRVLELGCGRGDLLASLEPSYGVGVDISEGMIAAARERHPGLEFELSSAEALQRNEQFDYIVLSDLVPYVEDLQSLFKSVAAHSHPHTRVVISTFSNVWRPLLAVLGGLGIRPRGPIRNWVAPKDLVNLAELAGLETVAQRREVLLPTGSRALSAVANGVLARLPGLRSLALTYWLIARPAAKRLSDCGVSVIVPARNEAGSIGPAVERIPEMGRETEIIFVEGGSKDNTRERIEEEIAAHPERNMRLVVQSEKGKWNAVKEGFDAASKEILMILDGDLTVPPEELPKFYEALVSGRGELINGSRLVYGMEPGAMRFLNMLGNKFFAGLLSFVLGEYVKDTLCGTKVLLREDYDRIRSRRGEFGDDDPFGDFELLLGAAQVGLKIVNLPIRYSARIYGDTNIQRFSNGGMLLRLTGAGFKRIWMRPVTAELERPEA
jgi:SAM-dependent methyltransferase